VAFEGARRPRGVVTMSLRQRLMDDMKTAMKQGDKRRVGCLRMLRSRLLEREVALRPEKGPDYEIEDPEATAVIATYAKQRRESIESYRAGGRPDLADNEEAELQIIQDYLPEQLSEERIREVVREVIEQSGASSAKDMGGVMKLVMARLRGAADGKLVSQIVRESLG
jgi:uncharacterized protein YqeY